MYSIITTPVNELVGEISKRPDTFRVKAFDDDSQAEELQFKTDTSTKNMLSVKLNNRLLAKAAMAGQEIDPEEN